MLVLVNLTVRLVLSLSVFILFLFSFRSIKFYVLLVSFFLSLLVKISENSHLLLSHCVKLN